MADTEKGAAFRRPTALGIGAAAMGVVTASIGIVGHPQAAHAVDYPSWNEVQQAKADVTSQQAMLNKINAVIDDLQTAATQKGMQAEVAGEAYLEAKGELDDATARADDLQKQADAAQDTAKTSSIRAGLLASHLMRTSGTDGSLNLLLKGSDAKGADALLFQLGTMSQLTSQARQIYDQAVADRNTASSLAEQAAAAKTEKKKASDAADAAMQSAQAAATAATAAVATQQQKQSELTDQLASLQNISQQKAKEYVAGQQAAAAAKAAAEEAARQAAAAAAAQKAAEEKAAKDAADKAAAEKAAQAAAAAKAAQEAAANNPAPAAPAPPAASAPKPPAAPPPSAPVSSAPPPPNSGVAAAAIAYAKAQLGKPYAFAGAGPSTFDCSGLTMMAYAYAGVGIGGHGVGMQYRQAAALGQLVPRSQAQPGDLLFWGTAPYNLYHVGIYLGGGMMIAAPTYGDVVKIQPVWGAPLNVVARPSAGH